MQTQKGAYYLNFVEYYHLFEVICWLCSQNWKLVAEVSNMATEATCPQEIARQQVAALNLTTEQLNQYHRKFDAFDLNKDGIISLREFAAVSKVFGYHLTKEEILVDYILMYSNSWLACTLCGFRNWELNIEEYLLCSYLASQLGEMYSLILAYNGI